MKRPVGRPKSYTEALGVLVVEGTRERIEEVRGEVSQADFLRDAVEAAISKARRKKRRNP